MIMMLNYKKNLGDKVEGIKCFERSLLPKKVLREKMAKLIENDFSKSNISSTIKLFKTFSDNECVTAVIAILEHVKPNQEVPNIYKILLKEIRKDSSVSAWLPSYDQSDTKVFYLFSQVSVPFSVIWKRSSNSHMLFHIWPESYLKC